MKYPKDIIRTNLQNWIIKGISRINHIFQLIKWIPKNWKNLKNGVKKKKQNTYVLKDEVQQYCKSDVEILVKSLIKFHDLVLRIMKIELLFDVKVITISSMALKIFFKITNLKNKLGIEPISGYNGGKTNKIQSKIALKCLNEIKNQIQHPHDFRWMYHKAGELKIGNYYIDGYDELTDTVFEFLGCFYHSCPDCFDLNKFNKKCGKMYGKLNAETINRLSYLKKRCHNLVTMKECEYKDKLFRL